jgi:heparin binding hemagglutinin HbhA
MPTKNDNKIPGPLYAAAGAGDLAIERLRKLPEKVAALQEQLPDRVSVLQDKVTAKVAEVPSIVAELRQRVVDADTEKLRESAKRNAETFFSQAQAQAKVAQEKAVSLYADLVARGEQVVGRGYTAPARSSEPIRAEVVSPKAPAAPKTADAAAPKTADAAEATEAVHAAAKKAERPAAKRARKAAK